MARIRITPSGEAALRPLAARPVHRAQIASQPYGIPDLIADLAKLTLPFYGYYAGVREGTEKGYAPGLATGKAQGRAEGFDDGWKAAQAYFEPQLTKLQLQLEQRNQDIIRTIVQEELQKFTDRWSASQ